MKSLILSMAFMLVSTFTFANSSDSDDHLRRQFMVTTSCGEVGMINVSDDATLGDIIDAAMDLDDWLCG